MEYLEGFLREFLKKFSKAIMKKLSRQLLKMLLGFLKKIRKLISGGIPVEISPWSPKKTLACSTQLQRDTRGGDRS